MRIILDGMGGDNAPQEIVKGAARASKHASLAGHELLVVGDEERIRRELELNDHDASRVLVAHASEVITNEDKPVKAIRGKRDSSLVRALTLLKEGEGDLLISAGNSGALMTGSLLVLGRISGVERPALGAPYPLIGKDAIGLLIDAGANSECKPRHLLHFAAMGSSYAEKVLDVQDPAVGLINMGTEPGKGSKTLKETYGMLQVAAERELIRFVGNIESREIPGGVADVMVCDGLTGNIVLKLTEGLGTDIFKLIKQTFTSSFTAKLGAAFLLSKLKEMRAKFDYSEYGGAPILGVKHPVIKIHGSSDYKSVESAILRSIPFVAKNVTGDIERKVQQMRGIRGKEAGQSDEE